MTQIIRARIMNRVATVTDWLATDPVLLDGETALVRVGSVIKQKVGDGIHKFSETDYQIYETGDLKGSLTTADDPGLQVEPVSYLAEPGTYPFCGGVTITGAAGWLVWDGTAWSAVNIIFSNYLQKEEINNFIPTRSINLFNKDKATPGYYVDGGSGNIVADALYAVSEYINVTSGKPYINLGFYAFYDSNRVFISGGYNSTVNPSVTAPVGAAFMRCTSVLATIDTFQVEQDITHKSYEPFYLLNYQDIKGLPFLKSRNLFDKTKTVHGYYVNQGTGGVVSNPDWMISSYIPVIAGQPYINLGFYAFYDVDKTFISGGLNLAVNPSVTAPVGAAFMMVSCPITYGDIFQVENDVNHNHYEPYGLLLESQRIKETVIIVNDIVVRHGGTIGTDCDFTDIKSALDSIEAASEFNRFVIQVKSGTYDISGSADPYLGFKNWVEIVGENKSTTFLINRKATFSSNYACIDDAFYSESIIFAAIRNMTLISYNGKSPIHIDSGYDKLQLGGTIEVTDCNLINENTSSMTHYQNGLACGLLDGQRVVVKNVNSNGMLWAHNVLPGTLNTGFIFELYNCRFPFTQFDDQYTYGRDTLIMKNCKCNYVVFLQTDGLSQRGPEEQFSITALLENNQIGYIIGTHIDYPGSRYGLWDVAFGGKFGISDSSIHDFCKNNTATDIIRTQLVTLADPNQELSVEPWVFGSKLYGMALDAIAAGDYGTIQYKGTLFLNSVGAINVNDLVALNSGAACIASSVNAIGIALTSVVAGGEIQVRLL